MGSRIELNTILQEVLGSTNVYFQPPSSHKMNYPCIRYELGVGQTNHSNNMPYIHVNNYDVMFISKVNNIDIIPKMLSRLPMVRHSSSYIVDNLYHHVFSVYY